MDSRHRSPSRAGVRLLATCAALTLFACGSPSEPKIEDDPVEGELPGDPAAPAVSVIPVITFEPDADGYAPDPVVPELPTSVNTILAILTESATTGQVNELLADIGARVVGGTRTASAGMVVLRFETTTHAELAAALATLRASATIRIAVPDVRMFESRLPAPHDEGAAPQEWTWTPRTSAANWGLVETRVPQAWNLVDRLSGNPDARVTTGVYDGGFFAHEDLVGATLLDPELQIDHGTQIACTIGAAFGNGLGIDGVSPFANLVLKAGQLGTLGEILQGIEVLAGHGARVVNLSVNLYAPAAEGDTRAEAVLDAHARFFEEMLGDIRVVDEPPLVVVSAGNAEGPDPAAHVRYSGAPQRARAELDADNILVVEAMERVDGATRRAPFSYFGGDVAAPGVGTLSCVGADGYEIASGTSFAAPYVTGLASYLLSASPSLSNQDLVALIIENATPSDDPASQTPVMDAFASVMDIDAEDEAIVLRLLLDIDDGTTDGNLRVDWPVEADLTDGDIDGDGGPGDGVVDMADFRRWRDWYHYTHATAAADFDGSADHVKHDVNGDGVVSSPGIESIHPRGDFNGDGMLDPIATGPVNPARPDRSDLDMLREAFEDPDYHPDDVLDLVDSGDIHIHLDGFEQADGVFDVGSRIDDGVTTETRTLDGDDPEEVYTVIPGAYDATAWALDAAGDTVCLATRSAFEVQLVSDTHWQPTCGGEAIIEITLADQIEPGTASPLLIRAGAIGGDGSPVYPEGSEILVEVFGGSVTTAQGTTEADGYFDTEVVFGVGTLQMEVFVTAKVPVEVGEGETRWDLGFARDTALALQRAEVRLVSAAYKVYAAAATVQSDSAAFPPATSFSGNASAGGCGVSVSVSLSADADMDGPDRMTGARIAARSEVDASICPDGFPPAVAAQAHGHYVFEVTGPVIATVTADGDPGPPGVRLGTGTDWRTAPSLLAGESGSERLGPGFYVFFVGPGGENGYTDASISFAPAPPPSTASGDER